MNVPANVSNHACDKLIELAFRAFPHMDPDEISLVLTHIISIMSAEVREAVSRKRSKMITPTLN